MKEQEENDYLRRKQERKWIEEFDEICQCTHFKVEHIKQLRKEGKKYTYCSRWRCGCKEYNEDFLHFVAKARGMVQGEGEFEDEEESV